MKKPISIELPGVPDLGAIHFLKAEWKNPEARAVLLRYSVHGQKKEFGLRLDLDKMAILDPLDDADSDLNPQAVRDCIEVIWQIVAKARASDKAFAP